MKKPFHQRVGDFLEGKEKGDAKRLEGYLFPDTYQFYCGGDPEEILICGVVTNICVVSNAIVLHTNFLNSRITVLQDLCAAPDPADHQNALRLLAGMGYHIQ